MEASEAGKEVKHFRALMNELNYGTNEPSTVYEDNKGCIAFSKNNTCHDRTKHIDIRAYNLRDLVKEGVVNVVHIDTKDQLADMLTKHQLKHTFIKHRDRIFNNTHIHATAHARWGENRKKDCPCVSCFVGDAI